MADVNGTGTLTDAGEVLAGTNVATGTATLTDAGEGFSSTGVVYTYGTKWTIQAVNGESSKTWKAYIKQRSYSGANTDLVGGSIPIDIQYKTIGHFGGTDQWNIATSTCTVAFYDDTTGKLSEILTGDDEEYQIVIENTTDTQIEWTGYVIPDSYSYSLYSPGISRVRATDRIEDLKNMVFASGITPYTGRDTLISILATALAYVRLNIGIATHMNWYPHIGTGALSELPSTSDPLLNLFIDRGNLEDADENPYSAFDVLEQILMSFQLQMYQVENRWHVMQRTKNIFDNSGDVFKVYNYTSTGLIDTTPTTELTARREVSVDTNSASFAVGPTAAGTVPIGSASVIYYHKAPSDGLLANVDFQSAIQTTSGTGIDNWRPGGPTPTAVLASPGLGAGATITQGLYLDSIYESTTAFSTVADAIANLSDYVEQTSNGVLTGGTNIKIQVDVAYKANAVSASTPPNQGQHYVFFELHVGSYKCFDSGHAGTTYDWAVSPTTDEEKLHNISIYDREEKHFTFTTEALDDSGTSIDGPIYFKIYAPTEDKNTVPTNAAQIASVVFDNVILTILDSDEEANTATQITLTYDGNVNRTAPTTPVLVFGDGPDSGYRSRLTVLNAHGVEQNITQDWSYLPSSAASGFSLHQFWANQMLREFGRSNRKITASIYTTESSEAPKPYHNLQLENPNDTLLYDYTWNSLSWRPASEKQVLSGQFIQHQQTLAGNEICTVNVKSGSALLQGISIAEGLPCLGTEPFDLNVGIYMVGDDDFYYTMNMDFTGETDTGLDLSTYNIINIARNQVTGRIYGLGSTGTVYSWADDGTDFQTVFTAAHSDHTWVLIDNANQEIVLSYHVISASSATSHYYNLAGTEQSTLNHFEGATLFSRGQFSSGGRGYLYLPHTNGNFKALNRIDVSDGDIENLQTLTVFGSSTIAAFDEVGGRAFWGIIDNLYLYNLTVENNPATPSFMTSIPSGVQAGMDFFSFGSDDFVVGCQDGAPLWSHRIGSGTHVTGRTTNDMRLVCTRQGWVP